jgi:hypothetical protein
VRIKSVLFDRFSKNSFTRLHFVSARLPAVASNTSVFIRAHPWLKGWLGEWIQNWLALYPGGGHR